MNTEFDYSLVAETYVRRFDADCRQDENCLHRLAVLHAPKEAVVLRCISPVAYPKKAGTCSHFRPTEKICLAWGISSLCNGVPYSISTRL